MPDPKKKTGEPKKRQNQATRQDSLALYNNALEKDKFYKNNKDYVLDKKAEMNFKDSNLIKKLISEIKKKDIRNIHFPGGTNNMGKLYEQTKKRIGQVTKNTYSAPDFAFDEVDYYYNPKAPKILISDKIKPQGSLSYTSTLKSDLQDMSSVPYYDPLAVKPFDLLTEKEKAQRVKQYGRSGVPDSYGKTKTDIRKPNTTTGKQVKENNGKGMVLNEILQKKPLTTLNNKLQPIGLQSNSEISAEIPNIPTLARIPKSWKIQENINQNFGGRQTNYEVSNIDLVPTNNLGPGNTRTITPQYAYGGQLNNNMQNNNLTRFDEGGLHHQNPLGGVPVGNGNTVEEGETKMKNYVYSNRLSIDENMTKEMNLPSYIKGKTFAAASKAIDNKFLDRNDNHSLETKKVFLERLKEAQETIKQQEQQRAEQLAQSMQSNQQEVPDMMNGEIPEGMEEFTEQPQQFWDGGNLNLAEIANMTGGLSGMAGKATPYLGAASGALSLGSLAQGNGASPDKFKSSLNGALTGAQAGMAFGPLGAGIGAAVGIGAGLLGANKANKAHLKDLNNQALAQNRQFQDNNFAKGGYLTSKPSQYAGGGYTTSGDPLIIPNEGMSSIDQRYPFESMFKPTNTIPQVGYTTYQSPINEQYGDKNIPLISKMNIPNPSAWDSYKSYGDLGKNINVPEQKEDKEGSLFSRNAGKFLRYAPVAMNAYQLAKLKKPKNQHLQRLSDKYKAQYVDEAQLQNIANQEMTNTINSISQSGASQGAIRSSMLGAGLNKTKALSDAYMKANAENRATDDKAQQFNLGVNQFNAQTQHQESENWERNAAAYRNEKSKYLSAIGSDLGEIGKEQVFKKQAEKMTGYSWLGDFLNTNPNYKSQFDAISKDSTLNDNMKYAKQKALADKIFQGLTPEQRKQAEDYQNSTRIYGLPQAYGGYLKMNKIGRK